VSFGVTNGNQLEITGTNVTLVIQGADGPTTITNINLISNAITIDANGSVTVGSTTNLSVEPVTTNDPSFDTNGVTIGTNGVGTNSYAIGTNTVTIVGTNVVIGNTTNSFGTNAVVSFGTNVLVGTNDVPTAGYGTNASFSTTLVSAIATNFALTTNSSVLVAGAHGETNTVVTTNLLVVTETTDYTNLVSVSGYITNVVTAGGSALVIADKGTNFLIPPAILSFTNEPSTNDIIATATHSTNGYSIKSMILNYTNASGSNLLYIKVQGLVKSTTDTLVLKVDKVSAPVQVTAETWTDVSGYGYTTNTDPIILGGTIGIGAPAAQTGPHFTP
jgi:hypothetical protein